MARLCPGALVVSAIFSLSHLGNSGENYRGFSFIYGVPDSGTVLPGALFRPGMGGPALLTGGSAGPEVSVLIPLVLGGLILVILKMPRRITVATDE